MNYSKLIGIVAILLLFYLKLFFMINSVLAVPPRPPAWFQVEILDKNTEKFPGFAKLEITYVYPDGSKSREIITIKRSPETISIAPRPNMTLYIKIYSEGYKESESHVYRFPSKVEELTTGLLFSHTFYLDPIEPTEVHVNVKNKMDQPIKDASINVTAIYANETHLGKTDEKGIFSFSTRFENFMVYVSAKGYKPFESELKVLHNVTEMSYDVVLEYISFARYTIEVKDEAWNYIAGAKVTLASDDYGIFSKIAEEGVAKFEIPAAKYTLTVTKEGYQSYEEFLDLSKPMVGGKVVQLKELPAVLWWQQHWYVIAGIIIVCIAIPLLIKVRKSGKD